MEYNEYRILEYRLAGYLPDGTPMHYIECCGNSDWTKPTTGLDSSALCAGSIALEVDTGTVFLWDEKTSAWIEQFSFQPES